MNALNALVIFTRNKTDSRFLHDVFRSVVGFQQSDEWSVRHASTEAEMKEVLRDGATAQICCADITCAKDANPVSLVRQMLGMVQLVLIVSPAMSPITYIRPGVMPAGILFKPLTHDAAAPLLRELVQLTQQKAREDVLRDEVFAVVSHGTNYRVPMGDILYFEARNKKLYLYTRNAEIEFYDTLEHLQERIPKQFIRCHKSFIVNVLAVEQVLLAQNEILMEDGGIRIPISRSCKAAVKEALA